MCNLGYICKTIMTSEETPLTKSRTGRDVTITKGYKSLLREVSTSRELDGELSKEQSDSKISDNLDRAEALFGALSRDPIQSWDHNSAANIKWNQQVAQGMQFVLKSWPINQPAEC